MNNWICCVAQPTYDKASIAGLGRRTGKRRVSALALPNERGTEHKKHKRDTKGTKHAAEAGFLCFLCLFCASCDPSPSPLGRASSYDARFSSIERNTGGHRPPLQETREEIW